MAKTLILLTHPFARKTFDVFNILRRDYSRKELVVVLAERATIIEKALLYLIYFNCNILVGEQYKSFKKIANKINSPLVFLPIEESSINAFLIQLQNRPNLKKNYKYLLPSLDIFSLSRNKSELNVWCEKNQIPSPKNYTSFDISQGNYRLPLIFKPAIGSGSRGIVFARNIKDLEKITLPLESYVIQECLNNAVNVEACFILAQRGKIVSAYTHQRVRTYPKAGGVSVLSKISFNKKIIKQCNAVVDKLHYSGLMMIEFIWDESSKTYKLIEINPRVWGSILLSESSGLKFINNYIRLCLGKDITTVKGKVVPHYIRWVLPYDLKNIFKKIKGKVVYINFSYANVFSSIIFHMFIYPRKLFKKS